MNRKTVLEEFRNNPMVIATLIRMNVELAASGKGVKELMPAPVEVAASLEKILSEQFEIAEQVAKLVSRYGFERIKSWMSNVDHAPADAVHQIRFAVCRSIELEQEFAIRQPETWFVSIWQRDPDLYLLGDQWRKTTTPAPT